MESTSGVEAALALLVSVCFYVVPLGLLIWLVVKVRRIERLLDGRELPRERSE